MASLTYYKNAVNTLGRESRALENQLRNIDQQVKNGAGLNQVDNQLQSIIAQANDYINQARSLLQEGLNDDELSIGEKDRLQTSIDRIIQINEFTITQANAIRNNALNQNGQAGTEKTGVPKDSAGAQVSEDARSKNEGANVQNPDSGDVQVTQTSSTAVTPAVQNNDNLAVTGASSQVEAPDITITYNRTQGNQASNTDDEYFNPQTAIGISTNTDERPVIASQFTEEIVATKNRLSGLASSTYTISIYLMNQQEYRSLMLSNKKTLPTDQLIMQSGGIPVGQRNPYFDVDFYIEDLEIESLVGTQEVGGSHNATNMRFTILEPQGITFLNRLRQAANAHSGLPLSANYLAQTYLMVIRFYGYDENGNLVNVQTAPQGEVTDPKALVEKFIPFHISNITYKIATKATEYYVTAVTPQTNIGFSLARATIPFNLILKGETVESVLGNGRGLTVIAPDDTADETDYLNPGTAPTFETVAGGLCTALNRHQATLVTNGQQDTSDRYNVIFEQGVGLAEAKLAKPGRQDKKQAPTTDATTAAGKYLGNNLLYNSKSRNWSVQAGTQIVQLIDLVLRSSSYITSQQNIIIDEKTGKVTGKRSDVDTVLWYRVRCSIEPQTKNGKPVYDTKRQDFAYDITYIISRYQINSPLVPGFPKASYYGVHKEYECWSTGENTEVLNFEIDVNANYLSPINQASLAGNKNITDDAYFNQQVGSYGASPFPTKRVFTQPNSSQQGGNRGSAIPVANLSDRLYNPVDVAYSNLEIVGDPDWIQQSDIIYNGRLDVNLNNFMPDGSVNYDSREVLYRLNFNPVSDYDIQTGLTPFVKNTGGVYNDSQEKLVFQAARVTNYFRDGMFKQALKGFFRHFGSATNAPNTTSDDEFNDAGIQFGENDVLSSVKQAPSGSKLPISLGTPEQQRRLQSNGNTINFNIDTSLPYRDVQINGALTRVYGSDSDLYRYYGDQAVSPKSGSTTISDDAGDTVLKN